MEKLDVSELKLLFSLVIEQLRTIENIKTIDIDRDMYRFVPTDKWQSFEQEPLIGSLYDDIKELRKIFNNSERTITYVDFDRIANVLHFISEKYNPVGDIPFED